MTEVLFPDPSFESFLYDEAVRFRAQIDGIDAETLEEAETQLRELLRVINSSCGYLGISLTVSSPNHWVDWSYGESSDRNLEPVLGVLSGELIGFGMIPFEAELTGEMEPSLAVIMNSTIYDEDLDCYLPVIIATPISSADISLMTE